MNLASIDDILKEAHSKGLLDRDDIIEVHAELVKPKYIEFEEEQNGHIADGEEMR